MLWRWPVGIQSKKRAKNKVKTFEVVEGIKKVSISPKMKNCTIWCKIETCPKLKNSHLGTPFLVGLIMAPRNLIWATFVAQLNVCVYAHYGVLGDLVSCEKILSRFHLFCFAIMCVCVCVLWSLRFSLILGRFPWCPSKLFSTQFSFFSLGFIGATSKHQYGNKVCDLLRATRFT